MGVVPIADATRGNYTCLKQYKGGLRMANGLFRGLLAGAIVGATAALLLAPKKGVLTRKSSEEKGTEDFDALREKVKRASGSATS